MTTFKCAVTSLCSFTGTRELADGLQRLVQLDLAAIDVESLLGQRVSQMSPDVTEPKS